MGERTGIEWADATWNPWRGCTKVSPGCLNCYMYREQARYGRNPRVVVRASDATFRLPETSRRAHQRIASGARVFTCSWSDWFHEEADAWRSEAWRIVRSRPDVRFLILTKRPERIHRCLPPNWGPEGWPNVWLGVSVETQDYVGRIDQLQATPCALRFVSAEPLLGPVSLADYLVDLDLPGGGTAKRVDWVIAGGESGREARPMNLAWVRLLRDECDRAGVPFFLKQLGGAPRAKRDHDEAVLDGVRHTGVPS